MRNGRKKSKYERCKGKDGKKKRKYERYKGKRTNDGTKDELKKM